MNRHDPQPGVDQRMEPDRSGRGMSWRLMMVLAAAAVGVLLALSRSGSVPRGGFVVGIVFVAVVLVAILTARTVVAARRAGAERESAREALSREHALTFRKSDEGVIKKRFRRLPEIKSGGKIKNVLTGELAGREMCAFEHVHVVHTGNAAVPVQRTVFALETPRWPRVDIKRKSALGAALRRLFGAKDLEFDLPEFNRRIRVTTPDPSFAITLLSPELQRHILTKPNVTWRLIDGWLCLIYSGALRFDRAAQSLERLETFWRLIPPELEYWQTTSAES